MDSNALKIAATIIATAIGDLAAAIREHTAAISENEPEEMTMEDP